MRIRGENLQAVASLLNDERFKRLMVDLEDSRQSALAHVVNCEPDLLGDARAKLKVITEIQGAILDAPENANLFDQQILLANTGTPDRAL